MAASPPAGVLVVDKPAGVTSFDIVKAVRRALGVRKAGHTGTLDPIATGVLPVCVGEATKIAGLLLAEDKAYEAEALLGVRTDTLDRTGRVVAEAPAAGITREQVAGALAAQVGQIDQVPPDFSALRVGGRRAHDLARAGERVELPPRRVRIDRCTLVAWDPPRFRFAVACGKGTYVRAIVRDAGEAVGCGAVLTALRRTRSGPFGLERAVSLDALGDLARQARLPLVSMDEALGHLPALDVPRPVAVALAQGKRLPAPGGVPPGLVRVRLDGALVAVGVVSDGLLRPKRVLSGAPRR